MNKKHAAKNIEGKNNSAASLAISTTNLNVGDTVKIKGVNTIASVLEILNSGKIKLAVGQFSITLNIAEIETLTPKEQAALASQPKQKLTEVTSSVDQFSNSEKLALERLDLHGLTVNDALLALETQINRAVIAKLTRIEVLHGIGSGKIKQAVHDYLKSCKIVEHYKQHEFNPGVTLVYL